MRRQRAGYRLPSVLETVSEQTLVLRFFLTADEKYRHSHHVGAVLTIHQPAERGLVQVGI
jgi:hypothetical protein